MPGSATNPSASARAVHQRLRLAGDDRVDQHSGLNSVQAPSFMRADLTTLHRSYSPSRPHEIESCGSRSAAMPADAAGRRIMRQASGWLMRWTDSVLPLWPRAVRNVIGEG
jgi:hypothetical protein